MKELSYTMRHQTFQHGPPLQPCCGKHHGLPFQHVRFYEDKRGRTKHAYECARCYKTLEARGQRPSNIRWAKPGSPHCQVCEDELTALLDASREERGTESANEILARIARNERPD